MDSVKWIDPRAKVDRSDLFDAMVYAAMTPQASAIIDPAQLPLQPDDFAPRPDKVWFFADATAPKIEGLIASDDDTLQGGVVKMEAMRAPHSDRAGIVAATQAKYAEEAIAATVAYCSPPAVKSNVKAPLAGLMTTASGDHRPGNWRACA